MSKVTAVAPQKILTPIEREFLKQGNRLMLDRPNGRIGAAALMDIVVDWLGSHSNHGFEQFAKAWTSRAALRTNTPTSFSASCLAWTPTPRPGGLHEEKNLRGQGPRRH